MKCPRCQIDLEFVTYEAVRIRHCSRCKGHLLSEWKLTGIERNPATQPVELKTEVKEGFAGEDGGRAKCPKCFFLMTPRRLEIPILDLRIDHCKRCNMVWLDGGELALFQMVYEASEKCRDAKELQRRINELLHSPERKAALDEALSKATGPPWLVESVLEDLLDGLLMVLVRHGGRPRR